MRTYANFYTLLQIVVLSCCGISVSGQTPNSSAPCLCLPGERVICNPAKRNTDATEINLGSNVAIFTVSDEATSLENNPLARYNMFWITGDGNFIYSESPANNKNTDLRSYNLNYGYHQEGRYTPVVYGAEKKSNDEPPGRIYRKVAVPATNITPVKTPLTPRLYRPDGATKTADILNHTFMRPKHPTAFAVSVPRDPRCTGVFFFYDSAKKLPNPVYTAQDIVSEIAQVELPNYQTLPYQVNAGRVKDALMAAPYFFDEPAANALGLQFSSFIYVPVTDSILNQMPTAFNEFRFFPVLKTTLADTQTVTQYLVLSIGSSFGNDPQIDIQRSNGAKFLQQQVPDEIPFFTTDRITTLRNRVNDYFKDILQGGLAVNSRSSIRGFAQAEVAIVGSIDPNLLEVTSACPRSDGWYDVTMTVEVCNKGYLTENNLPIMLSDLTGGHIKGLQSTAIPGWNLGAEVIWQNNWGNIPMPGENKADYQPQCQDLTLTVQADFDGLKALSEGQGLKLCVQFRQSLGQKEQCNENATFTLAPNAKDIGYACGGKDDCWWWIAVCFGLFIAFWWYWKNRKEEG